LNNPADTNILSTGKNNILGRGTVITDKQKRAQYCKYLNTHGSQPNVNKLIYFSFSSIMQRLT